MDRILRVGEKFDYDGDYDYDYEMDMEVIGSDDRYA